MPKPRSKKASSAIALDDLPTDEAEASAVKGGDTVKVDKPVAIGIAPVVIKAPAVVGAPPPKLKVSP
jgi:hypothetical protein